MRELPRKFAQGSGEFLRLGNGSHHVYVEKNATTAADPSIHREASGPENSKTLYPSNMYQKVLDYHIAEILLSTIVLAVIALLRLHR